MPTVDFPKQPGYVVVEFFGVDHEDWNQTQALVSRVPCIGEDVQFGGSAPQRVKLVVHHIHALNPDEGDTLVDASVYLEPVD